MLRPIIILVCIACLFSCRKKNLPSGGKNITSFILRASDNPLLTTSIDGVIDGDTIRISLSQTIASNAFKPTIVHQGASISPQSSVAQNFYQGLVNYVVTALDGTTKKYVVKTTVLSNSKAITLFKIRAADNMGVISSDITAVIRNDSIIFNAPVLSNLVPYIEYTGKTVSPASGSSNDFDVDRTYQVSAEDGTSRMYTVVASKNKAVYFGSGDGFLYALNAADGSLLWKTKTGSFMNGSVDMANGFIYAPSTGGIYCVNATTGAIVWNNVLPQGNVGTTPYVDGNMVYATNGGYGTPYGIHAMNATTGSVAWSKQVISGFTTSPTVWNNYVIAGDISAGMCALDKTNGDVAWIKSQNLIQTTPRVRNNNVYFSGELMPVYEVDATTGAVKRQLYDPANSAYYGMIVYNGTIYIAATTSLMAIDSSTLSLKWKYVNLSGSQIQVKNATPVAENGIVYFASAENIIYAVDATTGVLKWRSSNSIQSIGTAQNLTVGNGVLYAGSYDGNVRAYNATNGNVLWTFKASASTFAGALVTDAAGKKFYAGPSGHN